MGKISRIPEFTSEGIVPTGSREKKVEVDIDLEEFDDEPKEIVKESEEPVESTEPQESGEENDEETPKEVSNSLESSTDTTEVTEKIKIGDNEYSQEELKAIVNRGGKVLEWEKKMPGFDVDKLMPDYTRKSQRLAQYEKGSVIQESPEKVIEELGIEPEQVKAFEKIAKSLGFIRQNDLTERSVDAQKDSFLERHSEYLPSSPGGNEKWQRLMGEFGLYNWQANPQRVEELLERTHSEVAKSWAEVDRGKDVKQSIITKQAKVSLNSVGTGQARSSQTVTKTQKVDSSVVQKYRNAGWSEKDINELIN